MRKPFLTGCKRHNPRGLEFIISQFFCSFYIISTLATYFNKKRPSFRRFTKLESDFRFVQYFLYTLYIAEVRATKHQFFPSTGVENVSDHGTIGPRKFLGLPENISSFRSKKEFIGWPDIKCKLLVGRKYI